jgi:magnesium chelatase family protein
MSYAITYSRAYVGVEAPLVSVETHLSGGLPALTNAGYNNPHVFYKT